MGEVQRAHHRTNMHHFTLAMVAKSQLKEERQSEADERDFKAAEAISGRFRMEGFGSFDNDRERCLALQEQLALSKAGLPEDEIQELLQERKRIKEEEDSKKASLNRRSSRGDDVVVK